MLQSRQSGKTATAALLTCVLAILYPNEKIAIFSYTSRQAGKLFERIKNHFMADNEVLRSMVDLDRSMETHKEFSKKRMFLKNNTEIENFAIGKGTTEMVGEGVRGTASTIVIIDESGSIPDIHYHTKIMPILAAARSSGLPKLLIELGTPREPNHFYESWLSDRFQKHHVPWQLAVQEGRLSEEFVLEEQEVMTRMQFEMEYEAVFPSQSEEGLFDLREIERNYVDESETFLGSKILGVDVARFGSDYTVLTMLDKVDEMYFMKKIHVLKDKDTMEVAGYIQFLQKQYQFDAIMIDDASMGGGVCDRLKEMNVDHIPTLSQSKSSKPEDFANLKAELYFKAKKLFESNKLKVLNDGRLKRDLMGMKKAFSSDGGRVKIVDPAKSPDFADSLAYALRSFGGKAESRVHLVKGWK